MGRSGKSLFVASLLGLLVSGALLIVVLGYLAVVIYSALRTGTPIVGVLLDLAFPYLAIVGVLVVVTTVTAVGSGWGLLRRASIPRSARLQSVLEQAERRHTIVEAFGLSSLVAPPEPSAEERAEEALADLKRRYVAGEIDEGTFERKLDRLVSNDSLDDARAAREREATLEH
jgi:membrane protein implicated in regulation of membrane protease activity